MYATMEVSNKMLLLVMIANISFLILVKIVTAQSIGGPGNEIKVPNPPYHVYRADFRDHMKYSILE